MARAMAHVRDGTLIVRDGQSDHALQVGSSAWARWLEEPRTTSFRFEHGTSSFTARKERQRTGWYWYAYRRRGGRLRKAYLGRSRDLTLEHLVKIGTRLCGPDDHCRAASHQGATVPGPPCAADRHNLPAELSSFLGRQSVMSELRRLLGTTRLLTLVGTGGVGKTRLALRLAAGLLQDAFDAVWLVELAALADPALVLPAVAQATGVREEPSRPLLATLATALGLGRVLLVLDNCEHLLDACAPLAASLLLACPTLRILATSREPLGVAGEVAWRVPSLKLPEVHMPVSDLVTSEAVALFVERAGAARPGFVLSERNAPAVLQLCHRLDGIPLAIELAAAQVRFLTPEEILARLDDRFYLLASASRASVRRQQTLRAMVEWSYNLLTGPERRLFERVSVFAGGFTLEAAEVVCAGGEIGATDILRLLSRLVDCSLVLPEPDEGAQVTRYRVLETLRAYGQERLVERGEAEEMRDRHARWMVARAQRAEQAFRRPGHGWWLWWVEREHDNVRAALGWALERGQAELAVGLTCPLALSWLLHGQWSEGLDWTRRVLALPEKKPTRERGMLLAHAIELTIFQGDVSSNQPSGDLRAVRDWMLEYRALAEALHDEELMLGVHGLTYLLEECGVHLEGVPEVDLEETLEEARRIGHTWGECRGLEALARRALRAGDVDIASLRLNEAVQLARGMGDVWSLAVTLSELGDIERVRGAYRRAGELYEESMEVFAQLGLGTQPSLIHNLGYVALAAGDYETAQARFTQSLVQYRRLGSLRGAAECLMGLGAVAAVEGRAADAARLYGAGEAGLETIGMIIWPANRLDCERWQSQARRSLGRAEYERAKAEGRSQSLEQVLALVLRAGEGGMMSSHPPHQAPGLTPREREVAQLAAQGLSNREIAESLVITEKTAANHLQRVLDKLDLHSRARLAARASELGLAPASAAG